MNSHVACITIITGEVEYYTCNDIIRAYVHSYTVKYISATFSPFVESSSPDHCSSLILREGFLFFLRSIMYASGEAIAVQCTYLGTLSK